MKRHKKMKILPVLIELGFLLALSLNGQAATRSGFSLMMEITDPRSLALGGANVADIGKAFSAQVNPATSALGISGIQASYAHHPTDFWIGRVMAAHKISRYVVGLTVETYGFGSLEKTSTGVGTTGATFDAAEHLIGGYVAGNLIAGLNWGAAGKIGWWNIDDESASAGAVDLGLTYDTGWEGLRLGATARNLGSQWSASSGVKSPLSREFTIGGARKLNHLPLTLNAACHILRSGEGDFDAEFFPGNSGIAFGAGGEFEIQPKGARKPLNLRIGYRSLGQGMRVGHGGDALAGFSFGLGISVQRVTFDYTYAPLGVLGDLHRLGVSGTL